MKKTSHCAKMKIFYEFFISQFFTHTITFNKDINKQKIIRTCKLVIYFRYRDKSSTTFDQFYNCFVKCCEEHANNRQNNRMLGLQLLISRNCEKNEVSSRSYSEEH